MSYPPWPPPSEAPYSSAPPGIYQFSNPAYPPPHHARGTNSMANTALIMLLVFPLAAIVCGHVALSQIQRTGEKGLIRATVALTIGYCAAAFLVFAIVT